MSYRKTQHGGAPRLARIAIAAAAFALMTACGGGGGSNNSATNNSSTPPGGVQLQVVSFGDSLSDVGTYSPVIQQDFGGGRFTTNPGEVWTQKVAEYYGGTLSAAYLGGFGQPLAAAGGLGYAQGGADVTNPEGNGYAPNSQAATTWPVSQQVSDYLAHHTSFNSNQLVLINGGANDILQNLSTLVGELAAALAGNANPTQQDVANAVTAVLALPLPNDPNKATLGQTAQAFVAQVGTILGNGATHVAVMNVPDIGQTPLAASLVPTYGAQVPALISAIVSGYNTTVQLTLQGLGIYNKVVYVDSFSWLDTLSTNYQAQGFTVASGGTACNINLMAQNAQAYATKNPSVLAPGQSAAAYGQNFASSLFCAPNIYTVAGADQTYVFADLVHPSTHGHALFAQYVEQQIAASGLGK